MALMGLGVLSLLATTHLAHVCMWNNSRATFSGHKNCKSHPYELGIRLGLQIFIRTHWSHVRDSGSTQNPHIETVHNSLFQSRFTLWAHFAAAKRQNLVYSPLSNCLSFIGFFILLAFWCNLWHTEHKVGDDSGVLPLVWRGAEGPEEMLLTESLSSSESHTPPAPSLWTSCSVETSWASLVSMMSRRSRALSSLVSITPFWSWFFFDLALLLPVPTVCCGFALICDSPSEELDDLVERLGGIAAFLLR